MYLPFRTQMLIGCGALATLPAPLMAQATPTEDARDQAEILVIGTNADPFTRPSSTASRLGLSPLETPASITVLQGDEIRARGDLSIVDAVTRAPGITTSANPGNGGTALVSRGFSGQGSVLQLVDGVRLFPVAGTQPRFAWSHAAERWLYITHRWVGIVTCLLLALWFVSALVMLYVACPSLTRDERLAVIDWSRASMGPARRYGSPPTHLSHRLRLAAQGGLQRADER